MYSNYILVCGDFNLILDNNLDNVAGNSHSEREIRHFRDVVASLDSSDVCRKQHTEENTVHSKAIKLHFHRQYFRN